MLFWLGLVTGLIVGWVIEWFIDWRFWRRELNTSLQTESRWQRELQAAQREIVELRGQLAQLSVAERPSETPIITSPKVAALLHDKLDKLEVINGIGPAFAQRLHAAGVHTFVQLSELAPERLLEIIHPEPWQAVDPGSWIAQARQLAQKNQ